MIREGAILERKLGPVGVKERLAFDILEARMIVRPVLKGVTEATEANGLRLLRSE